MTTNVERQQQLEQECLGMGVNRYRGDVALPWQASTHLHEETDKTPGKKLLSDSLEPLADAIAIFVENSSKGRAGTRVAAALPYLAHVDPLQAAYIAAKVSINKAARGLTVQAAAIDIGTTLAEHMNMVRMAKDAPGLYRKVSEQLKRSTSSKHRLGVYRHVREKYKLETLTWSEKDKLQVGMKLVELFVTITGLAEIQRDTRGKNNTPTVLKFAPEVAEWLVKAHAKCELLAPVHMPMVAPPKPWTNPYTGGYLTPLMHTRFVASRSGGYLDELGGIDLSKLYAGVNAVQATPWKINRAIYDVIVQLWETGGNVAGLPRRGEYPMPPIPAGIPKGVKTVDLPLEQQEAMKVWKAEAAKVYADNGRLGSERVSLAQALYVANRFKDEEAIYFPHYVDFRGRIYPFASYVNPQSDDVGKSMLQFAVGKPLGEDGAFWLAVHIAGLWGVDKVSFDDRVQWVVDNEERILACAVDPLAEDAYWREADKPFQALAASIEWAGYKLEGNAYVSHLPVAMDGSCSGLQHFSALLRDEVGGAAVNLVPHDKPSDIYMTVADRAQVMSDSSGSAMAPVWEAKVCRKIAKQPTMTLCYSATKFGMQAQIEHALAKLDEDGPYLDKDVSRHDASVYMAGIIWEAIGDVVVAAKGAMAWLKKVSDVLSEVGLPIRWTSPIGFPVLQEYREQVGERVNVFVGGQRLRLTLVSDSSKLASRRQKAGIAPNFVHSLDSAHLISTVNLGLLNGLENFAVIHDSFATHACDVSMLNAVLREAFVEQYRGNILEDFREEVIEQLRVTAPEMVEKIPPTPPMGNLDIEAVKDSDFFFA